LRLGRRPAASDNPVIIDDIAVLLGLASAEGKVVAIPAQS